MGEFWPRSPVLTERSEVCTSDRGQDSPIQTNLARLIRCLLYGQTRNQRNKRMNNFVCFPARAQAFSRLSSGTPLPPRGLIVLVTRRPELSAYLYSLVAFGQLPFPCRTRFFRLAASTSLYLENSLALRMLIRLAFSCKYRWKLRWKPLYVPGSYPVPFCLRTEMKNLDKRRSGALAGMFSIALDSFCDSQNFFHAFKSLLVL